MVLLGSAFHQEVFLVPIVAMVCFPSLAMVAGSLRKAPEESKLWTALTVTGFLLPLTWFVVVLIALMRSDI
jgi:hypothetical protein